VCKLPVLYNKLCDLYVIKINWLMMHREMNAVCSDTHTKHINTLCEQNVELMSVTASGA